MTRLFVRHTVSDFDAWKKGYDEFNEERKGLGVKGHAVFRSTEDPKDVTVWHDFENADAAKAFMEAPGLRNAMQKAGVTGQPVFWITEEA